MKNSLSLLVSALVLTGCLTTETAKKTDAEPTAATTPATNASTPAANSPTASTSTSTSTNSTAASAPCADAPTSTKQAATKGKTPVKKKTAATKDAAAAPCANVASAAGSNTASNTASNTTDASGKREVKGMNDWTGYIQGVPAPKSKFNLLKIGMSNKEVTDLIGQPTDQQSHVTGKAWIPFYMGAGRYETYYYYKGVGRLLFSGNGGFTTAVGLTGIEHDATERGYSR